MSTVAALFVETGGVYSGLPDDPGAVAYVEQGRYGHLSRKATWLYAVGVNLLPLRWGRTDDSVLGAISWGSYLYKPESSGMRGRPRVTSRITNGTPLEFRDTLIEMARTTNMVAS